MSAEAPPDRPSDRGCRLLVVDRSRLVAEALAAALGNRPWVASVTLATRLEEAGALLTSVDLVLVAADQPTALADVLELRRMRLGPPVVVRSVPDREDDIVAFAELGVAGLLTQDEGLASLDDLVPSVLRGDTLFSTRVAGVLLRRVRVLAQHECRGQGGHDARLTPRETEVLALIELGWTNKQIAQHLSIEVRTVKNHVHNLLEKLRVRRRGEAAALRLSSVTSGVPARLTSRDQSLTRAGIRSPEPVGDRVPDRSVGS